MPARGEDWQDQELSHSFSVLEMHKMCSFGESQNSDTYFFFPAHKAPKTPFLDVRQGNCNIRGRQSDNMRSDFLSLVKWGNVSSSPSI